MHESQAPYRRLYELVHSDDSGHLYSRVLAPWAEAHRTERDWLRSFADRAGNPVPPAAVEELWRLYALSRVNETLLRFQGGQADGSDWPGPAITLDEYAAFAESLGLAVSEERIYSPFHHEVVEVEQAADEGGPVVVLSLSWPCLMLGEMLFSRAGARVSAGRRAIRKEVAESSTMYWAHWRKNRPYEDLSHGWGSNSQWRTSFRRDYRKGGHCLYNIDGTRDLSAVPSEDDRDGPSAAERVELLTNRCFVRCMKPHGDLWPYDDTLRTAC
jgi:hypothetical protein